MSLARSWIQARQQAPHHLLKPGDVSYLASKNGQRLARTGMWYPPGRVSMLTVVTWALALVLYTGIPILLHLYYGLSLFTALSVSSSQFSFQSGKALSLRNARKAGSPCVLPFAYCPPERLDALRKRYPGDVWFESLIGHRILAKIFLGVVFLFLTPAAIVLYVYGGWHIVPFPVLIAVIASFVHDSVADSLGHGRTMMAATTDLFLRSCDALINALESLQTFHYITCTGNVISQRRVDWKATYLNYDALCQSVADFSAAWRFYFFVVEFNSVPNFGLALIGLVQDSQALSAAAISHTQEDSPPAESLPLSIRLANVLFGLATILFTSGLVVGLWTKAAGVTAACDRAREAGLEAFSEASGFVDEPLVVDAFAVEPAEQASTVQATEPAQGTSGLAHAARHVMDGRRATLDMDIQRERARGFVAYADLKRPGFSMFGITISFHLGAVLAYPLITGMITLAFPFTLLQSLRA